MKTIFLNPEYEGSPEFDITPPNVGYEVIIGNYPNYNEWIVTKVYYEQIGNQMCAMVEIERLS